jgi:hypothetical protein
MYALVFVTRYLDIFWNFSSLYNSIMKIVFLGTSFAIIYFIRMKYRHSYDKYGLPPCFAAPPPRSFIDCSAATIQSSTHDFNSIRVAPTLVVGGAQQVHRACAPCKSLRLIVLSLLLLLFDVHRCREHDSFRVVFLIGPALLLALVFNPEFSFFEILWAFSIYLEALAILPQLFLLQRTGEVETLTSHYIFALGGYRAFYLLNWIYRLATEPGYSNWIVWIAG